MLFVPPIHTVHAHMLTRMHDAIGNSICSATLQKISSRFEAINQLCIYTNWQTTHNTFLHYASMLWYQSYFYYFFEKFQSQAFT